MIQSITFREKNIYRHSNEIPFFQKKISENKTIKFVPQINMLVGPNGSGKTTFLNILKYLTGCHMTPINHIKYFDENEFIDLFDGELKIDENTTIINFNHNYFENKLIDDNFSSGQAVSFKLNNIFNIHSVERKTIIFDEPNTWLDIENTFRFMKKIFDYAQDNQIILSTHSIPFFLLPPDVLKTINLIELKSFYYSDVRMMINNFNNQKTIKLYDNKKPLNEWSFDDYLEVYDTLKKGY